MASVGSRPTAGECWGCWLPFLGICQSTYLVQVMEPLQRTFPPSEPVGAQGPALQCCRGAEERCQSAGGAGGSANLLKSPLAPLCPPGCRGGLLETGRTLHWGNIFGAMPAPMSCYRNCRMSGKRNREGRWPITHRPFRKVLPVTITCLCLFLSRALPPRQARPLPASRMSTGLRLKAQGSVNSKHLNPSLGSTSCLRHSHFC